MKRRYLIPFFIISSILMIATVTVAILFAAHGWRGPKVIISWTVFLLQLTAQVLQIFSPTISLNKWLKQSLVWISYLALGILSTLFISSLFFEVLYQIVSRFSDSSLDAVWIQGVIVLTLIHTIMGLYQALGGPWVKEVAVKIDRLPATFKGLRIVQVSDLHVSLLIQRSYVEKVVAKANTLDPDLVVLTGDFVDGDVDDLREMIEPLSQLKSRHGRFFITGNHEYYHNGLKWIEEHKRLGETVLLNQHVMIRSGEASLALAGVTDRSAGSFYESHKPSIAKALEGVSTETVKILLAHQPGCFEEALAHGVDLQLSGHTHGGQFVPWQFVVNLVHRYAKGLYRHGSMWIYVNPGTGFWGPPLRTLVPGEITLLTLD